MKKTSVQTWRATSLAIALIIFNLSFTIHNSYAQYNTWDWAYGPGAPNDYFAGENAAGVAVDSKGNVYLAGSYSRTFTVGNTTLDGETAGYTRGVDILMLIKYNASGEFVWAKSFGYEQKNNDIMEAISIDSQDRIFIGGKFGSDTLDFGNGVEIYRYGDHYNGFIARLDTNGTALWAINSEAEYHVSLNDIYANETGVYFTGSFHKTVLRFGDKMVENHSANPNANSEGFVAKCDADGTMQWIKGVSGSKSEFIFGVSADDEGNVGVVGKFTGEYSVLDLSYTVKLIKDGDVYQSMFIVKYDTDGNALWARSAYSPLDDKVESAEDVVFDKCGNMYVSGWFNGQYIKFDDIKVDNPNYDSKTQQYWAKFDTEGNALWAFTLNDGSEAHHGGITLQNGQTPIIYGNVNNAGAIILGDSTYDRPQMYMHPFLASLEPETGEIKWSEVPEIDADEFWYIAVDDAVIDHEGNIISSGNYVGYWEQMDTGYFVLGFDTVPLNGYDDCFVGKISRNNIYKSENEMLSFDFPNIDDTTVIDSINHTISVAVAAGTNVSNLTPDIIISKDASLCEYHKDFTSPVIYTVYAENEDAQQWTVTVTGWDTSIDEKDAANNIAVYPNPSNGNFKVVVSDKEKGVSALSGVEIYSIDGKMVYNEYINVETRHASSVQISTDLNKGIYFIKISSGEKSFAPITKKIIIN